MNYEAIKIPLNIVNKNLQSEIKRLDLDGIYVEPVHNLSIDEFESWSSEMIFHSNMDEYQRTRQVCKFLSHVKALVYAFDNEICPFIILDDSVEFLTDNSNINIIVPANADLFYLGGLYWWKNQSKEDYTMLNVRQKHYLEPFIKIYPDFFSIASTYSYMVQDLDFLHIMIETLYSCNKKSIELMFINYIQRDFNCFVIQPSLCIDTMAKNPNHHFYNDTNYANAPYNSSKAKEFYNNNYSSLLAKLSNIILKRTEPFEPHKTIKYLEKLHLKKE